VITWPEAGSPRLLFGELQLFVKTWNDVAHEVRNTRGSDADQRILDVIPRFQGLVLLLIGARVGLRLGGEPSKTISAPILRG
jgi:hypothetical protein